MIVLPVDRTGVVQNINECSARDAHVEYRFMLTRS